MWILQGSRNLSGFARIYFSNFHYSGYKMKIDISTKNIKLDEPLRIFIEDKIGGLDHLIGNNNGRAKVEIGMPSKHHRSGMVYSAEVNLSLGGKLLRATCTHKDLRNAVTDVKDELQVQIKKFKEKRTDLLRQSKDRDMQEVL